LKIQIHIHEDLLHPKRKGYLLISAVWSRDHTDDGFAWVDCKCDNPCVFGYIRTDGKQDVFVCLNFSDKEAEIAPDLKDEAAMLLNTDWESFGGKTAYSDERGISKCRFVNHLGHEKKKELLSEKATSKDA